MIICLKPKLWEPRENVERNVPSEPVNQILIIYNQWNFSMGRLNTVVIAEVSSSRRFCEPPKAFVNKILLRVCRTVTVR